MTEQDPTPVFRRFPWIQLVFCLACLSMTALTWMRYSYAWDMDPDSLCSRVPRPLFTPDLGSTTGPVDMSAEWRSWSDRQRFVFMRGNIHKKRIRKLMGGRLAEPKIVGRHYILRGAKDGIVWAEVPVDTDMSVSSEFSAAGRVTGEPQELSGNMGSTMSAMEYRVKIDTTASRFHPASIAGLVVGAMGCFIFGLYLRRWMQERKALASQPRQDMIA